jgi:hypothetical protein
VVCTIHTEEETAGKGNLPVQKSRTAMPYCGFCKSIVQQSLGPRYWQHLEHCFKTHCNTKGLPRCDIPAEYIGKWVWINTITDKVLADTDELLRNPLVTVGADKISKLQEIGEQTQEQVVLIQRQLASIKSVLDEMPVLVFDYSVDPVAQRIAETLFGLSVGFITLQNIGAVVNEIWQILPNFVTALEDHANPQHAKALELAQDLYTLMYRKADSSCKQTIMDCAFRSGVDLLAPPKFHSPRAMTLPLKGITV